MQKRTWHRWRAIALGGTKEVPMRVPGRLVGPALLAAALILGGSSVARAGGSAGGDITFRLILRGDVVDGDAFSLGVNDLGPTGLIISAGVRCGPGSEAYNPEGFVACRPGTYEVVLSSVEELPVGTPLSYAWARIPADAEGNGTTIFTDTITVTENAQVFTVVYDYGGGSALPNTAIPAPAVGASPGIVAVIGAALAAVAYASWRRRRSRGS